MRFTDLSNFGGFIWWLFVRFTKTDLVKEQSQENWSRNIFIVLLIFTFFGWIISEFF